MKLHTTTRIGFPETLAQSEGVEQLGWTTHHWKSRHAGSHEPLTAAVCADSPNGFPKFRCTCTARGGCCEHANEEDGLCLPCREWCPPG